MVGELVGIDLNVSKRELLRMETRHLGFTINLKEKVISITQKHQRRIVPFFSQFLGAVRKDARIAIR